MRFRAGPFVVALACALFPLAAAPAQAQALAPKDAWEVLTAFLAGTGASLTTPGLRREGDAIVAPAVRLQAGEALELRFDSIRLEPRGAEVAVIPAPRFGMVSTIGMPGERRSYEFSHDGEFVLGATDARAGLALSFARLAVTKTDATRDGRPIDERLELVLNGLVGQLELTLAEPVSLQGALRVAVLDQDQRVNADPLPMVQEVRGRTEALEIRLAAAGLRRFDTQPGWMRQAFADGLRFEVSLTSGRSESWIDQTFAANRTRMQAVVGSATSEFTLADGVLAVRGEGQGFDIRGQMMGIDGAASMARMDVGIEMPMIATPDNRPFRISMALEELAVAGPVLARIGATSFADDRLSAALDLQADGRWLVEITENPDPQEPPFDLAGLTLNRLSARLGTADLTGAGSLRLAPGAFAEGAEGVPEGEGDFTFELRGGDALLGRLAAAGLIPPDQQFMARMILAGLGRPVGEDHLRSEVAIRPGGQLTVNGLPLPF